MALGVHQKLLLDDINHRCAVVASQGQLVTYGPADGQVGFACSKWRCYRRYAYD